MILTEGQILDTLFTLWTLPTNDNYTHRVVGWEGHVALMLLCNIYNCMYVHAHI